jgi:hypothetical protein
MTITFLGLTIEIKASYKTREERRLEEVQRKQNRIRMKEMAQILQAVNERLPR